MAMMVIASIESLAASTSFQDKNTIAIVIDNQSSQRIFFEEAKIMGDVELEWSQEVSKQLTIDSNTKKQLSLYLNKSSEEFNQESVEIKIFSPDSFSDFIITKITMLYDNGVIRYCFTKGHDCMTFESDSDQKTYEFESILVTVSFDTKSTVTITIKDVSPEYHAREGLKQWWKLH